MLSIAKFPAHQTIRMMQNIRGIESLPNTNLFLIAA